MVKKYMVYVDLDGVLADFAGAVEQRFGEPMESINRKKMWTSIKHYNENVAPWFYSLSEMDGAQTLWGFVTSNFKKVEILTASGSTPRDAPGQKRKWVGEHLGWDIKVNVVGAAGEKAAFAKPNTILIDDRRQSIDPFIREGGIGILHTSADSTIRALKVMMEDWD